MSLLAKDVASQFELITGESISLFFDRDDIEWGEDWNRRIDAVLESTAFFIPILTPRYFKSTECRRELQLFARRATELGIRDLILPIHYIDVLELSSESATDDLVILAKTFQWADWRELRLKDPSTEDYRRNVAELATRLAEANRKAEASRRSATANPPSTSPDEDSSDDETPGVIDRLARAELALPEWLATVKQMDEDIRLVGQLMNSATDDVRRGDSQRKGFAARLGVARRLAKDLSGPAERLWSSGNNFVSQMHDVDGGLRQIVELAPAEIARTPEAAAAICTYFAAITELAQVLANAFTSTQTMIDSTKALEPLSRDLRPVLRRLQSGLGLIVEVREVSAQWDPLIGSTGIKC